MAKVLTQTLQSFQQMYQDYFSTRFVKTIVYYLPLVILLYECVIWIFSLLKNMSLIYDEFLLLHISAQPLTQMLETVQVEPHPIGFYFILKGLLSLGLSEVGIRLVLILNFFCVSTLAVTIGYASKIIPKYHLSLGLSLVLVSYQVFSVYGYIKQDVVSFPLFFLFLLSSIALYFGEINNRTFSVLLKFVIFFCASAVILTSYIYTLFIAAILGLLALINIQKKDRLTFFSLGVLFVMGLFSIIYFFSYGHYQISNNFLNKNRFLWTSDIENSFILRISESLIGIGLFSPFSDFITILFIGLFMFYIFNFFKQKDQTFPVFFIVCFICVLTISYILRLFVQIRYTVPVYLFFLLICSLQTNKVTRKVLFFFVFILLFTNYLNVKLNNKKTEDSKGEWIDLLVDKASKTSKVGIISNLPTESVYLKVKLFNTTPNIYAIRTSNTDAFISNNSIDRNVLSEFSETLSLSPLQLLENYRSHQFSTIVFFELKEEHFKYYDPESRIQESLYMFCDKHENIKIFSNSILHYFYDCS